MIDLDNLEDNKINQIFDQKLVNKEVGRIVGCIVRP